MSQHQNQVISTMGVSPISGFFLPEQSPTQPSRQYLLEAKATQHWLASLSDTRIGTTARELYNALQEFNRIQLKSGQRQATLMAFVEPIESSCRNLESYYLNKSVPLDGNTQKIAQINMALKLELALSFKILLKDLITDTGSVENLALAIQGALIMHLSILRQNALTYNSYPKLFWRETNQLFALALQYQVQSLRVLLCFSRQENPGSIEDSFRQLCLAGLSDHYRLRQLDIRHLFHLLPELSADVQLCQDADAQQENRFIILLQNNMPALPLAHAKTELLAQQRPLFLKTDRLINRLEAIKSKFSYNNLSGEYEYQGLSSRTFAHLQQVWGLVPKRHAQRTNLYFELNLIIGLKAIYNHQVQARNAQSTLDLGIEGGISSLLNAAGSEMQLELDSEFWKEPSINIIHINEQDYRKADISKTDQARGIRCQIINESDGGYCLSWNKDTDQSIKVGELLGTCHTQDSDTLSLALCRWIKQEQNGGMLGIALLSSIAQPVDARLLEQEDSLLHHCLLLEKDPASGLARLLTPPLAFRAGQRLAILQEQGLTQIHLLELLESSPVFNIYTFEQRVQR